MVALSLSSQEGSLADAVVASIRLGVSSGELSSDGTYSVYQLAAMLGVSRSPVREALLRLAEAGLVEISKNRGFRVLRPRAEDVQEIVDIRLALEPLAVRRAAESGTSAALDEIRQSFERMQGALGDEQQFWLADQALHDCLIRAGGNSRVASVVEGLRTTASLLGPPTTASGRTLSEILHEHEPIVLSVLAREPVAAERAMRAHLTRTGELLMSNFDDGGRK